MLTTSLGQFYETYIKEVMMLYIRTYINDKKDGESPSKKEYNYYKDA